MLTRAFIHHHALPPPPSTRQQTPECRWNLTAPDLKQAHEWAAELRKRRNKLLEGAQAEARFKADADARAVADSQAAAAEAERRARAILTTDLVDVPLAAPAEAVADGEKGASVGTPMMPMAITEGAVEPRGRRGPRRRCGACCIVM